VKSTVDSTPNSAASAPRIPLSFRGKLFVIMLLAAMVMAFSAPSSAETLLGVYYGKSGTDMQQVHNLEVWQGKRNATVLFFSDFCNSSSYMYDLFHHQLLNIWNNHNVPVISWMPSLCNTTTPTNIDERIAIGDYNSYLNTWANELKAFLAGPDGVFGTSDDRRVYIRFAHEMNGTWYPWSANRYGQTPTQYIAMWRHVHSILESKGLTASHVQWVWCVNNGDVGAYKAEQYYPGSGYVDWVGIDGYNWGNVTYGGITFKGWKTPSMMFGAMIGRMRKLAAKPIAFMETGTSPYFTYNTVSTYEKNLWIPSLYSYAQSMGVKMVIYYNVNGRAVETSCCQTSDWAVFGGSDGTGAVTVNGIYYKIYSNHKSAVGSWWMVGTNPTNKRLLTDSQFAGSL
jgi:glycosyl hydrolase family 26